MVFHYAKTRACIFDAYLLNDVRIIIKVKYFI